jgi:UDPglucose 6-dehydrogenase
VDHLVKKILGYLAEGPNNVVAILGLAYKPNTPVIEESPGVKIIEELLKKKDVEIIVYDPLAMDNARAYFGDNILYASSVKDCFSNASLCVITTQAEEFTAIRESDIRHHPTTIIDCWRILEPSRLGRQVRYLSIGIPAKISGEGI